MQQACEVTSTKTCLHCGLPVLNASDAKFCCNGCKLVYQVIHDNGLERFYELRESGPSWQNRAANPTLDNFSYLDSKEFGQSYVFRSVEGLSQINFYLEGLHCAACIWLLEKASELMPGVKEIRVNFARSSASVIFEPSFTKLSGVARILDSLGYTPHPLEPHSQTVKLKEDRRFLMQLGVAALCFANVMLLAISRYQGLFTGIEVQYDRFFVWTSFLLTLPAMLFSALPFYRAALSGLRLGKLHIDLPIAVALVGSFIPSAVNTFLGRGEVYFDSITALIFLLLCGRLFQRKALRKVSDSADMLRSLTPIVSHRLRNGICEDVFIDLLQSGDELELRAGETVPADGVITNGSSFLNLSVLSGEADPVPVRAGDTLFAGTTNLSQTLRMRVERLGSQTRIGRLIAAIEETSRRKSPIVQLTDRLSVFFVAGVFALSIFTFFYWFESGFFVAMDRVIALLVVTCPCALGIATPITIALSVAKAAREGIMIVGADTIERACSIRQIVFDKTGTLTQGHLVCEGAAIDAEVASEHELYAALMALESNSVHPCAKALTAFARNKAESPSTMHDLERIGSRGIKGRDSAGNIWMVGSSLLLHDQKVQDSALFANALANSGQPAINNVVLIKNSKTAAFFSLRDSLRPDAKQSVTDLSRSGFKLYIASGDRKENVTSIASSVGIESGSVYFEMTPEEKINLVDKLRLEGPVAMVGDGVNDAAALKASDLGIAAHGGAEICMQVADLFLAQPGINKIYDFFTASRRTLRLIHLNLLISAMYNIVGASLAVSGRIGPLGAAVIMPLSSLTVIVNALLSRPFRIKRN